MSYRWRGLMAGRYRREPNDYVLEVIKSDGIWWWSCWKEDEFYASGTAKKLKSGKTLASRAMTFNEKKIRLQKNKNIYNAKH